MPGSAPAAARPGAPRLLTPPAGARLPAALTSGIARPPRLPHRGQAPPRTPKPGAQGPARAGGRAKWPCACASPLSSGADHGGEGVSGGAAPGQSAAIGGCGGASSLPTASGRCPSLLSRQAGDAVGRRGTSCVGPAAAGGRAQRGGDGAVAGRVCSAARGCCRAGPRWRGEGVLARKWRAGGGSFSWSGGWCCAGGAVCALGKELQPGTLRIEELSWVIMAL